MSAAAPRRHHRRRPAAALLGALLAAVAGAADPAAAKPVLISSCTAAFVIDEPGHYVLARDLVCPAPAIRIAADNVRLDLGGRTLTRLGSDPAGPDEDGIVAEGLQANRTIDGLRVENGTVTGFDIGLRFSDAPGVRVTGVTTRSNDQDGIFVLNSPGARLKDNTAADNDDDGLDAEGCDGCVITGNQLSGNEGDGLEFEGGGARIKDNAALGNGGGGITAEVGGEGNRLEGNQATGNGRFDLEDFNLTERTPPACVNSWRGNHFGTDNETGAAFGPGVGCIR
jgi:parallel beta-helix repeat protein